MGTLQEGLASPRAGTQKQQRTAAASSTPAATKRSGMDVVRALREARARQQTAKATAIATEAAAAQQEETTEMVAELLYADEALTAELTQLNRQKGRHQRGSVQAEDVRTSIDQLTDDQTAVRRDLSSLKTSNFSAHARGVQRYNTRQEALEMAEANRQLIGSITAADIRSRRDGAIESGFIAVTDNRDEATFSFDRQGYISASPNDSVSADDQSVSDVAASLKELVDDLRERKQNDDDKIVAELHRGGFYISARRDPDGKGGQLQSELDLLRDEGVTRSPRTFLSISGERYVARVGGPLDFVVLENRDGEFFAVKATSARAGRFLFTRPDRQAGEGIRVAAKSAPRIVQTGKTITPEDVSNVVDNQLRLALEEDLRREAESAERREAADELRDISGIENPLTLGDIATGGTGIAPISISYEDPENNHRRHTVTFRVTGNGTTFSVTSTVPGTEETIKRVKRDRATRKILSSKPFLPDFIGKETPLGVLEKDPLWRLVRDLNRPYERDWRLAGEAERRNAVPVTHDNLDGLIGLEGQDGAFAVRATLRKNIAERGQEPHYVYNPVGYIMERNGSKVKVVWAVPGTSANYARGWIGNEYDLAELPSGLWFVLGNVHWMFTKEEKMPPHIQRTKRQDAATDTEE